MKTNTIILAIFLVLALGACNNSGKSDAATDVVSTEDSSAFEIKAASEALEQQAEELDQEVDSLVNSLN